MTDLKSKINTAIKDNSIKGAFKKIRIKALESKLEERMEQFIEKL